MPRRPYLPRKEPSQERSEITVDSILESATRIFEAHGYPSSTTAMIAEKAGVSVGTLYQYFPNKLSLLAELKRRHFQRVMEELEGRLSQAVTWLEGIQAAIQYYISDCSRARAFLILCAEELPARPFEFGVPQQLDPHHEILRRFFEKYQSTLPGRDPARTALVVGEMVNSTTLAALRSQPDSLHNGVLEKELNLAISSYLGAGLDCGSEQGIAQ